MSVGGATPTIHGTWEDLFARIADGTYATAYSLGEILPLDLGTEGVVNAQIVGFNHDDKADGSGKARITFIAEHLLNTSKRINPALSGSTEGTGTIGGFGKSELRTYLRETIQPMFPSSIRSRIVEVTKHSNGYDTSSVQQKDMSSSESVWIPTIREIQGNTTFESGYAAHYSQVFPGSNNSTRVKKKPGDSNATIWWTRMTI